MLDDLPSNTAGVSDAVVWKEALVRGGAGFRGSHLCDALIRRGYDFPSMDNFHMSTRANIPRLPGHPRFGLLYHDVISSSTSTASTLTL